MTSSNWYDTNHNNCTLRGMTSDLWTMLCLLSVTLHVDIHDIITILWINDLVVQVLYVWHDGPPAVVMLPIIIATYSDFM